MRSATVIVYGSPGSIYTGAAASLFDPVAVDVPMHLSCGSLDHISNFSSCEALQSLRAMATAAHSHVSQVARPTGVWAYLPPTRTRSILSELPRPTSRQLASQPRPRARLLAGSCEVALRRTFRVENRVFDTDYDI